MSLLLSPQRRGSSLLSRTAGACAQEPHGSVLQQLHSLDRAVQRSCLAPASPQHLSQGDSSSAAHRTRQFSTDSRRVDRWKGSSSSIHSHRSSIPAKQLTSLLKSACGPEQLLQLVQQLQPTSTTSTSAQHTHRLLLCAAIMLHHNSSQWPCRSYCASCIAWLSRCRASVRHAAGQHHLALWAPQQCRYNVSVAACVHAGQESAAG
jgi:hypothetical protein